MLALRLARGAHPLGQFRRLLVACATACVGFLLLTTLTHALAHPEAPGSSVRLLLWCLVPLAATVQFAAAVARVEPGSRSRSALDAAGVGPAGLPLMAAASTAVACLLGSVIALLVFLHLRGELTGMPFDGAAVGLLAADRPLPLAAALTLLCVAPLAASATAALTTRPLAPRTEETADNEPRTGGTRPSERMPLSPGPVAEAVPPARSPGALPWGVALAAAGLALETLSAVSDGGEAGATALDGLPPGVILGCIAVALGVIITGPGIVHLCGRLTACGRPGAERLLAGRALQQEAERLGRPWGMLCAVAAGGLLTTDLYAGAAIGSLPESGPLHVLGTVLVVSCAVATVLTVATEIRATRAETRAVLARLGAPSRMLLVTAGMRAGVLLTALLLVAGTTAFLTALPLA